MKRIFLFWGDTLQKFRSGNFNNHVVSIKTRPTRTTVKYASATSPKHTHKGTVFNNIPKYSKLTCLLVDNIGLLPITTTQCGRIFSGPSFPTTEPTNFFQEEIDSVIGIPTKPKVVHLSKHEVTMFSTGSTTIPLHTWIPEAGPLLRRFYLV